MVVHCKTHNAPRPTWYRVSGQDGEGFNVLAFTKQEARVRFLELKGWTRLKRGYRVVRLHRPSRPVSIPLPVQKTTRKHAVRKATRTVAPVTVTTVTVAPVAQDVLNVLSWIEPNPVVLL